VVSRAILVLPDRVRLALNRGKVENRLLTPDENRLAVVRERERERELPGFDLLGQTGDRTFSRRAITLHNARLVFKFPSIEESKYSDAAAVELELSWRMLRDIHTIPH